jgi:hypothetical protein
MGAAESAQELRKQNKLQSAREQLNVCAQAGCPGFVRRDCRSWLAEVDAAMPTLILRALDDAGKPLSDVRVLVDGTIVVPRLGDAPEVPLEVDPGPHTVRFERTGSVAAEQRLTIGQGEKRRSITVHLASIRTPAPAARPSAAPEEEDRPVPTATYVLGGIGLAALAGFVGFGLAGSSQYHSLENSCKPHCTDDVIAPVRTKFLIANVSLAIAGLAVGAAAIFYFTRPAAGHPTAGLTVTPSANGAAASMIASF